MKKYKALLTDANAMVKGLMEDIGFEVTFDKRTKFDFIMFSGGADLTPSLYDRDEELLTMAMDPERDLRESNLVNMAKIFEIPRVGICRGHQLLHVMSGGTLVQHVDGHRGRIHPLSSTIPGWGTLTVNSTHHQAVPMDETKMYDTAYGASSEEGEIAEIILDKALGTFSFQYHPEYTSCPSKSKEFFVEIMQKELKEIL